MLKQSRQIVRTTVAACVALLILSSMAFAQGETAAGAQTEVRVLKGHVIGDDNVRIVGAKVRVIDVPEGKHSHTATTLPKIVDLVETDATGEYRTKALPSGDYRVTIEKDGYEPLEGAFKVLVAVPGKDTALERDFLLKASRFWMNWGPRSGLDLALLQPGSFAYFDTGTDEEDEVDLFVDGKLGTTVQLIGADAIAYSDRRNRVRVGLNFGVGIGTSNEAAPTADNAAATKSTAVLMLTTSFVADFAKVFRLQAGWIQGVSTREKTGSRDDSAVFVGITLRTQLGEQLLKLIR